jgi:two-component sensor histidine kinase
MKCVKLIILLFFGLILKGQMIHYAYKHYSTKDGLPSSEVYCVLKDHEGYLWFSTDNGLSRFDGYEFKNYGPKQGLTDPVIFDLEEDKHGRIWFISLQKNIFYVNEKRDSIICLSHLSDEMKSCTDVKFEFHYDNNSDNLIVHCKKKYALNFYKSPDFNLESSFELKDTFSLFNDGPKTFYNLVPKNGSQKVKLFSDGKTKSFNININTIIDKSNINREICKFESDYFFMTDDFTFIFRENELNSKEIDLPMQHIIKFGSSYVYGLRKNMGVFEANNFESFNIISKHKKLLDNVSASYLLEDNKTLWATTTSNGIYHLLSNIDQVIDFNLSLTSSVRRIVKKSRNELYYILDNGDIYSHNFSTYKINKIEELSGHNISDLIDLKSGFFGLTNDYQVYNIKKSNSGHFLNFDKTLFSIKKIFENEKGDLNYYLNNGGLDQIDLKNGKRFKLLSFNRIKDILFINNKEIYFVSREGFLFLNDGKIRPVGKSPLLRQEFEVLRRFNPITFVLGSKTNGIVIYEGDKGYTISQSDGLCSNTINDIVVRNDSIWVGTEKGLNLVKYKGNGNYILTRFTSAHGLPGNEVKSLVLMDEGNTLTIGTNEGVYIKYLEKASIDTTHNNESPKFITFRAGTKFYDIKNKIILGYNQNNIRIEVKSINFRLGDKVEYQYKIGNGEWISNGNNRFIDLSSLQFKHYKISVRSNDENNLWSQPAILSFTINPPWWQSSIFYLAFIFSFLGASYIFYRRRINKQIEQSRIKQEINQLERAALQSQMNPHFIFNSLNSIQNYIVNSDRISASEYLSKFAILIRLNLQYSDKSKITLKEELNLLELYLQLEKLRFKDKFKFTIDNEDVKNELDNIYIPPMLIQPIVENSIKHGISRLTSQGLINISFRKLENNHIEVKIMDNGLGITEKKTNLDHLSMGTSITSKRLSYISKDAGDGFSIKNISNEKGEIEGTLAILVIALQD